MKMALIGTGSGGTIRRCGLVGAGVVLLEEVCAWERALRAQKLKSGLVCLMYFLLPMDPDVELSAPLQHVCLHAAMLPAMTTMG